MKTYNEIHVKFTYHEVVRMVANVTNASKTRSPTSSAISSIIENKALNVSPKNWGEKTNIHINGKITLLCQEMLDNMHINIESSR